MRKSGSREGREEGKKRRVSLEKEKEERTVAEEEVEGKGKFYTKKKGER